MVQRKNNPRYKPVLTYTEKGQRITYIKNEKPFEYERNGEKGVIFAINKQEADKKLNLSSKQNRYDFGNIVVFARNYNEAVKKAETEKKRRILLNINQEKKGRMYRYNV